LPPIAENTEATGMYLIQLNYPSDIGFQSSTKKLQKEIKKGKAIPVTGREGP
jgi:hypothetical protein